MAAPPSPRPPKAHPDGGDAPVSLFLDTGLGTRLALLVAPDTSVRRLKSQVAAEHAAAFPDLGPVAVKSFQVRRKGALYHLSDSMTVTSAFTRIKGGYFLHVNMEEAPAATRCFQGAPAIGETRTSEGCFGVHVGKHVRELPSAISEIATDTLPHGLQGGDAVATLNVHARDAVPDDVLLPPSSQMNIEMKKSETVGLASDADIDKSSKQTNISNVVEVHGKKDILHGDRDHDGGNVSDNKQGRIEEMLGHIHAVDDLSQGKESKKAKRTGSVHTSAADPTITNESAKSKSSRAPLDTNTTHGELSYTSFRKEVNDKVLEDSLQTEDPGTVGKKKKRKRCQLAPSEAVSVQETTKLPTGAVELSKSGDDAYNVELTNRDETTARSSVLLSKSELNDESYGRRHVQRDAQASTDLTAEQGNADHVHNGYRNPSIGDTSDSTAEVPASGGKTADGSNGPWDGGEKLEQIKQHQHNERSHDEGVAKTSNMEEDGKNADASEKGHKNENISQEKKRKKAKKVNFVDMASMDTAGDKGMLEHTENVAKADKDPTKREDVHYPSIQPINMEKDGKNADALEKRHTNDNISQEKKRKKAKKVDSVVTASIGTAGGKKMLVHTANASKSDKVSTERDVVHDPSVQPISDKVLQGDSNIIENPDVDGKQKKRRRRHLESSKGADPNQDLTKSSEFVANDSLMEHTYSASLDAKKTAQGSVEGETVNDHNKLGESIAAANVINEVLADLNSKDSLSKDLDGDLLTGQTHLGSNPNALELPESTGDKVVNSAALPPKHPEAVHSNAPIGSPSHNKPKGKKLNVLSAMIDSSHLSSGRPEEDAYTELKESDALRSSGKASDLKDVLTEDVVAQADDKTKATKRQRKKVKQVPTDIGKATQSSDKQVDQVAREDLKGVNATEADLVQENSVIDTSLGTVAKVQQKSKRSSKTRAPKILEINHPTHGKDSHSAKDGQNENTNDITGTHDNENAIDVTGIHDNENSAGDPTKWPVLQEDATTLRSSSPNARKERKKSLSTEVQIRDFAMEPSADLVNFRADKGMVSPKSSADAAEPNHHVVVDPASDEINFLHHFSSGKMNDQSVNAGKKQYNEDETIREVKNKKKNKRKQFTGSSEQNDLESLLHTDTTSLFGRFGTSEVGVPSITAENMNRECENVKNGKEKKRRKRKPHSEGPGAEEENLNGDHDDTDIGTQDSLHSVVQKGRMGQDNGNENNKVTENVNIMQQEPEDATCDRTLEKKLHRSNADFQNNLPIDKDNAHISKELWKSTSHKQPHAKISKLDEFINETMDPDKEAVSNLVKSFSMSPPASSDRAEGTPQIANRYRLAVRKVPRKRYEQTSEKSRKYSMKVGSGEIFSDAISEGSDDAVDAKREKAAVETALDNSSTSADSGGNLDEIVSQGIGISSAPYDESEVPDDDDAVSLSQKSLKGGLHIGSILRGSSSYKKARQKHAELFDDDTEVPDSQPADGLWN